MHTLIFNKETQIILQSRFDNSTGEKMSIDNVLQMYCKDTNTDQSLVEIIEIPFVKFDFEIGKQIYNKQTGAIEFNQNYVEPPSIETSSIPVSDPNGNAQ